MCAVFGTSLPVLLIRRQSTVTYVKLYLKYEKEYYEY